MEAEFNHLNHATWECKYHVVFTPKYRKKLLFGKIKRHLGQVFQSSVKNRVFTLAAGLAERRAWSGRVARVS
jgi:putative transposase